MEVGLLPIEIEPLKGYILYNHKLTKLDPHRLLVVAQQICTIHQCIKIDSLKDFNKYFDVWYLYNNITPLNNDKLKVQIANKVIYFLLE